MPTQSRIMYVTYNADIRQILRDFKSELFMVATGARLRLGELLSCSNPIENIFSLLLSFVTVIVMLLTLIIIFIITGGFLFASLIWANIYAMAGIYPGVGIPEISEIIYQFLQIISSPVMQVSMHIANSVKTQYSTIVKAVTEIKSNIEHSTIRYTHVRIITPSPASS